MHDQTSADSSPRNASNILTINVTNDQAVDNDFFFFQNPGTFGGETPTYVNSLFSRGLGAKGTGGLITLAISMQYFAGVQDADAGPPQPGHVSGYSTAYQATALAAANNVPPNPDCSTMLYDPNTESLGLSLPVNVAGVLAGAFRITTASFTSPPKYFNAGSVLTVNGQVVLSSFASARPRIDIECRPILKYYVANGRYDVGTVVPFAQVVTRSALCDFTDGFVQADITYKADGTWQVEMS